MHSLSGCSVARLSRLLWEQEAAGSNPATPTSKSFLLQNRRDFLFQMNSGLPENSFKIKKTSSLSKLLKDLLVIESYLRISNPAQRIPQLVEGIIKMKNNLNGTFKRIYL